MPEPQLSLRSAKAITLAHRIEDGLERYEKEFAAESRACAHDGLCDARGLLR